MSGRNPCRYGAECRRGDCHFEHPQGWVRPDGRPCRFGAECRRGDCRFQHPQGWVRPQAGQPATAAAAGAAAQPAVAAQQMGVPGAAMAQGPLALPMGMLPPSAFVPGGMMGAAPPRPGVMPPMPSGMLGAAPARPGVMPPMPSGMLGAAPARPGMMPSGMLGAAPAGVIPGLPSATGGPAMPQQTEQQRIAELEAQIARVTAERNAARASTALTTRRRELEAEATAMIAAGEAGWNRQAGPVASNPIWVHRATGMRLPTVPTIVQIQAARAVEGQQRAAAEAQQRAAAAAAEAQRVAAAMAAAQAAGWRRLHDPTTNRYYWNHEASRTSIWDIPTDAERELATEIGLVNERHARVRAALTRGWPALELERAQDPPPQVQRPLVMYRGARAVDAAEALEMVEDRRTETSFCPVCLEYTQRNQGCLYMHHQCNAERRHPELYARYQSGGQIWWCTDCGRICRGHRHHIVNDIVNVDPTLVPLEQTYGTSPFDATCVPQGGGGFAEKRRRFYRLIATMCLSEDHINRVNVWLMHISRVRYVWRADVEMGPGGVFFIPCALPERLEGGIANVERPDPNVPPPANLLLPVAHRAPDNECIIELGQHDDGRQVWQLRHNPASQHHHDHEFVCADDLYTNMLRTRRFDTFCPIPGCREVLWPEELVPILTAQQVAWYRALFNTARRAQGGGGGNNDTFKFLKEMEGETEAQCGLPNSKKGGKRVTKKSRRSRKQRQTMRR